MLTSICRTTLDRCRNQGNVASGRIPRHNLLYDSSPRNQAVLGPSELFQYIPCSGAPMAWPLRLVCILLSRRLVDQPVLLRLRLLRLHLHLHLHLRLRHLRLLPVEYVKVSILETEKKKKKVWIIL